jgi:geranylgeranyl reductase
LTFESYMHKNMARVPWVAQLRMTADILSAQVRHYLPFSR